MTLINNKEADYIPIIQK